MMNDCGEFSHAKTDFIKTCKYPVYILSFLPHKPQGYVQNEILTSVGAIALYVVNVLESPPDVEYTGRSSSGDM